MFHVKHFRYTFDLDEVFTWIERSIEVSAQCTGGMECRVSRETSSLFRRNWLCDRTVR